MVAKRALAGAGRCRTPLNTKATLRSQDRPPEPAEIRRSDPWVPDALLATSLRGARRDSIGLGIGRSSGDASYIQRRRAIRLSVAAVSVLVAIVAVLVLSIEVSLRTADRFLQGPPTFSFPDETGQPIARCHHTGIFGLIGSEDACTLTFPSGNSYRCWVDPPGSEGISAGCDQRRFRS